jgi:hypothetical protein
MTWSAIDVVSIVGNPFRGSEWGCFMVVMAVLVVGRGIDFSPRMVVAATRQKDV